MKNSLLLFLSQHRAFWWMRSFVYKVFFWIGAQVFRHQFNARDKKDNLVSLRHLFQITQAQLILALLFAIFLQLIDPVVFNFYKFTFLKIRVMIISGV